MTQHLGFGVGLRPFYQQLILETLPKLDWLEVTTENYLGEGGCALHYLEQIRAHYPIALHGVSLSIGSTDPIDWNYLTRVKRLAQRIEALWISDHLCWTGVGGVNLHDLLPMPYTEQAARHVASRVSQVQDFLQQQILLENVSSYMTYSRSEMSEWEFLALVAEQSDCLILLDVNNVYVSAMNHDFDPDCYLQAMSVQRVRQFHLAGHLQCDGYILDTHAAPICEAVWSLYSKACQRFAKAATLIERDDEFPGVE